jgi:UDP-glucuronate 4-epimerase
MWPYGWGVHAVVTGAAGFIGSTLCEQLLNAGWSVSGVDCLTDYYDIAQKRQNIEALAESARFDLQLSDLRQVDLDPIVSRADVVFHLAAQPGVRGSWADGFALYDDQNVRVTQRILESVRTHPSVRLVFASSSSVYGNPERVPTDESDRTRPFSPYGVTKLAGEHLCQAYADNYGVALTILRYFTVYGPRQRPDMAIHRLIEAARRQTPFPLFGDGSQVRDFTYVGDVVAANIAAATAPELPDSPLNIAGGSSTTLLELVSLVGEAVGSEVPVDWQEAKPGDVDRTGGAVERARALIGWQPMVALQEGIRRQVDWHVSHLP